MQVEKKEPKWYEWSDETFQKAKIENKAIFLFVTYQNCVLCKQMQEDVLSDDDVLKLLEDYFVCIMIDRDERADLDRYYQKSHILINNRIGGWPLSLFATSDNKPFFAGTYIELDSQVGSIEGMGFKELAKLIGIKVANNDEDIKKNAQEIDDFLQKQEYPTQATMLSETFKENFMLQVKNNYEVKYGGFSKAPKFPHTATLSCLLYIDKYFDDKAAKAMVQDTLSNMAKGGYFDKEEGGFFRYAKSDDYVLHSNDKTLYDNALLCEIYLKGYQYYGREEFLVVAKKIADFWCNSMMEDNLFYLDIVDGIKNKKIISAYNGMMIRSLFLLGGYEQKYKNQAIVSLDTLKDTLFLQDKLYRKIEGVEGFLEDYAYVALGCLEGYKQTQNEHYLIDAQRLVNGALENFYDRGNWNFSSTEFSTQQETNDNIYKSAISVMVEVMGNLSKILQDEKYAHFAFKTLEYNSYELGRKPSVTPSLLEAMFYYLREIK